MPIADWHKAHQFFFDSTGLPEQISIPRQISIWAINRHWLIQLRSATHVTRDKFKSGKREHSSTIATRYSTGSVSDRIQVGATQSVQYGSVSDRIQVTSYSILDLDTTRIISDPELDLIAG